LGPVLGETVMPFEYVNAFASTGDPLAVVTMRGTGNGLCACGGVTAVNVLVLTSVMLSSGSPPRVAERAGGAGGIVGVVGKLLPETVMVVPPNEGPAI